MAPENASPGLLFGSFLYRKDLFEERVFLKRWEENFGKGFVLSPRNNPLNEYYSREMGPELQRVFFLTSRSYPREYLLTSKLLALRWEEEWKTDDARMVNIDTGILSAENFLLATTKNYSHRVYLGQKIFADLTYYFHQGSLQTLPWTYPDYLDDEKRDFFTWGRSFLLQNRPIDL